MGRDGAGRAAPADVGASRIGDGSAHPSTKLADSIYAASLSLVGSLLVTGVLWAVMGWLA